MAGSPAEASRAFGAPASARDLRGLSCRAVWPALGLTVTFLAFEGHPCLDGAAVQATVTGRTWLTEKGLRVGATVAEARRLYPAATLERGAPFAGLWLVRRRACAEVGGEPFPGLLARLARGRVSALVVTAGVCD